MARSSQCVHLRPIVAEVQVALYWPISFGSPGSEGTRSSAWKQVRMWHLSLPTICTAARALRLQVHSEATFQIRTATSWNSRSTEIRTDSRSSRAPTQAAGPQDHRQVMGQHRISLALHATLDRPGKPARPKPWAGAAMVLGSTPLNLDSAVGRSPSPRRPHAC